MTKRCSRCGDDRPLEMFAGDRLKSDGLSPSCKPCNNARMKEYRDRYPDRVRESTAKWRSKNVERVKATTRAWKVNNREDVRRHNMLRKARRRAIIVAAGGSGVTQAQWEQVLYEFDRRCAYCNSKAPSLVVEHMDPLAFGGAHDISNVVPACHPCNNRKHTFTVLEFLTGLRLNRKAAVAI